MQNNTKFHIFKKKFMKHVTFNDLSQSQQQLLLSAKDALPEAYAPYSKFHVAAAV